jgi:hypothetical protein
MPARLSGVALSTRLIALYTGFSSTMVLKAIARLRAAGIIEVEAYGVHWERFGTQSYDPELGERRWDLIGLVEKVGGRETSSVFPVIASFGRPDLSVEEVALLSGVDDDAAETAIAQLRRAGLIRSGSLEVDRDDLLTRLR